MKLYKILIIAITTASISYSSPPFKRNKLKQYKQFTRDLGSNPNAKAILDEGLLNLAMLSQNTTIKSRPRLSNGSASIILEDDTRSLSSDPRVKFQVLRKKWNKSFKSNFHGLQLKSAIKFYRYFKRKKIKTSESEADGPRTIPAPKIQNQTQSAPSGNQAGAVE